MSPFALCISLMPPHAPTRKAAGAVPARGQQKRLEGALLSQPSFPGKGSRKSMGLSPWAFRGLVHSQCKERSSFPGLAQIQAFGTWGDTGRHLLGGHCHTRKPLLQDRHMLKWFPESRSWPWNWEWQVEVPLPTNHLSRGYEWNRDVKTAGWRSKRGGFKLARGNLEKRNSEYLLQGFM